MQFCYEIYRPSQQMEAVNDHLSSIGLLDGERLLLTYHRHFKWHYLISKRCVNILNVLCSSGLLKSTHKNTINILQKTVYEKWYRYFWWPKQFELIWSITIFWHTSDKRGSWEAQYCFHLFWMGSPTWSLHRQLPFPLVFIGCVTGIRSFNNRHSTFLGVFYYLKKS